MSNITQSLDVVFRLYPEIVSGEKKSTIRWGEPTILPGPLQFLCIENPSLSVNVNVVCSTEMPLSAASAFVNRSNDWSDVILLAGMREHYSEIELSSVVQVIEFQLS